MNSIESEILRADLVTSVFGYWPTFHDAEVVDFSLSRSKEGDGFPVATATIHAFRMTKEVSPSGHFVCDKHSLITLRFSAVENVSLEHFNHQNALQQLILRVVADTPQSKRRFEVTFDSAYGLDCSFSCAVIEVVAVTPGIPPNSVYLA